MQMSNLLPDEVLLNAIESEARYIQENPNSCVKTFMDRLRDIGFQFSVSVQVKQFMPKHKDIILPLAVSYFDEAVLVNERNYFISLMRYPCCKSVVPKLLAAFYRGSSLDDRERISECIYSIHDKTYAEEYLKIISTEEYGVHRAMFILLLGRLKYQNAIEQIIALLQDPKLTKYAIISLGDYKNIEFRDYFERYVNSGDYYLSRYAKQALKKLGIA